MPTKNKKPASREPAAVRDWFRIRAQGEARAELSIFGDIGEDWFAEESNTAKNVVEKLKALGDVTDLTVRINSYGGSVADGIAIYNALRRHPANVSVVVEGVAVSIASLIAMAGDTIEMPANTLMMVHSPWGGAVGNAKEMREMADVLDKYAEAMATSYATKTGKPHDEMLALLSDGEDHWFTAAEAVEAGFADYMTGELAAAASLRMDRFSPPAAPAAQLKEEVPMTAKAQDKAIPADQNTPEPQGATPNVSDIEKAAEARFRDQIKARNTEIQARFSKHMHKDGVQALYSEVIASTDLDVDAASARLLDHLGKDAGPLTPKGAAPHVEAMADESDKRKAGVSAALLVRAGIATPEIRATVDGSNPWRGSRLIEIAAQSCDRAGVDTRGMMPMEIVAAAFTQSTSDFPVLLEDAMHKAMLNSYRMAADTWSRFCATGSVSDFRPHHRYRSASIGNYQKVNENGEFVNVAIPDGEKASVSVDTQGLIVNMSRKMVVNDDLGAFLGMAAQIGRSGRRTVEAAVYALLGENAGLGPTQADGQPLFHANRSNVDGTGGVNSVARWDAMRVIMAQQKDVGGNDYLDLRPAVWVGPVGLGGLARQINEAEYDDESQKNQRRPNITRGLVRDLVDTPRLSGTRYYLFADPSEAPVIEVSFLDGQQEPVLERMDGFDVDGTRYKGRLDFGVSDVDFRGAVTNAGG